MDQSAVQQHIGRIERMFSNVDDDAHAVQRDAREFVVSTFGDPPQLTDPIEAILLMNAAGAQINAASRLSDIEGLTSGEAWMTAVRNSGLLVHTDHLSNMLYNLANSRIEIADLLLSDAARACTDEDRMSAAVRSRWEQRDRLVDARFELSAAAALSDSLAARSASLCNLANTFDHSGRWIEAYDAYVRALEADPTNGNAAGNAAVLIGQAVSNGWDFEGHLCSLHDRYLALAKEHRDRTVAVAGEAAARRFDDIELLGSDEPQQVGPDPQDPYQVWITENRLALVAALEGLGHSVSAGRWDTVTLRSVVVTSHSDRTPPIFDILNVLKADYLVARRLAFEAVTMLEDTAGGWEQHPCDPGVYAETLNYTVPGEASSKLVLAHRAALDVLDKTAVAVNEHLLVGDDPTKVMFRRFWFEKDGKQLRSALLAFDGLQMAVLSMAELALDMQSRGIYGHAQEVRNAGTHRFVLLHHGIRELDTTVTTKTLTVEAMVMTVLEALTVARAAYLYLVAMMEAHESLSSGTASLITSIPLHDAQ